MTEAQLHSNNIHKFYTNDMSHEYVGLKSAKQFYVTGHITANNVDAVKELVPADEMDKIVDQLNTQNIKLDIEHSQYLEEMRDDDGEIAIGKIIEAKKVEVDGLTKIWVKAQLNKNHKRFKEVWKSIEDQFIDGFSISWRGNVETITVEGETVKVLRDVIIRNVALTGVPINNEADMTGSFLKALGKEHLIKKREGVNMQEKNGTKSLEKGGAHAHTKDDPLGDHKHPEIESYIKDELRWLSSSLDSIWERIWKFDDYMDKINMKNINSDEMTEAYNGLKKCDDKIAAGMKSFKSIQEKCGIKSQSSSNDGGNKLTDEEKLKADKAAKDKADKEAKEKADKEAKEKAAKEGKEDGLKSIQEGIKNLTETVGKIATEMEGYKSKITELETTNKEFKTFLESPNLKSQIGNSTVDETPKTTGPMDFM